MSTAEANVAATVDQDRAIDTVTAAFNFGPHCAMGVPRCAPIPGILPRLVRTFAGEALESGTAHSVEAFSGAAL
jgi:hypothetical protein